MTLTFRNPGLIEPAAITTLGVNAKEGDSPIGFFGTGLKYTIAGVLRLGGTIRIWRGNTEYDFFADKAEIRGKEFSIVHMRSPAGIQPLGFTTDLGKTWEPWMFLRELHCNAKDEGGETVEGHVGPLEGWTTIHLTQPEIEHAWTHEKHLYFLDSTPFYETASVAFHERSGKTIFYQGINVGEHHSGKPWRYTPNLKAGLTLTENRTVDNQYNIDHEVAEMVATSTCRELIEFYMETPDGYVEGGLTFQPYFEVSDLFLEIGKEFRKTWRVRNFSIRRLLDRHLKPEDISSDYTLDDEQKKMLEDAIVFCKSIDFQVDDFPIVISNTLGKGVLGLADDGKIKLSAHAFEDGNTSLIATLIEEYTHLSLGYSDCTRELQDFFLRRLVTFGRRWKMAEAKLERARAGQGVPF